MGKLVWNEAKSLRLIEVATSETPLWKVCDILSEEFGTRVTTYGVKNQLWRLGHKKGRTIPPEASKELLRDKALERMWLENPYVGKRHAETFLEQAMKQAIAENGGRSWGPMRK